MKINSKFLLALTACLLLVRLLTLGTYPLMDTTEARYGEIARKMLELGDWITPWYEYGTPFWAKPPLSFWLTALSFKLFGVNEFAARLPHFLAGLLVIFLVWGWALSLGRTVAIYSIAILSSAVLFLISAGAVMTDMTLAVGTTLVMRGFWMGLYGPIDKCRRERWLVFIGLSIGLLAKGPLVFVITGLPIFIWTVFFSKSKFIWNSFPWVTGGLLSIALAAPWYVLAEAKTPGFLNYFIIGEHWDRFITSGWTGDLYGKAHAYPRGTIWLMAVEACMPWAVLLPLMFWRSRKARNSVRNHQSGIIKYLLIWAVTPCVFFTFAGNILPAYVLPALPAISLACAYWMSIAFSTDRISRWLSAGVIFSLLLITAAPIYLSESGRDQKKSAKLLVKAYQDNRTSDEPLYFVSGKYIYSAAFYTNGKVKILSDISKLDSALSIRPAYVAITAESLPNASGQIKNSLRLVSLHGNYALFKYSPNNTP